MDWSAQLSNEAKTMQASDVSDLLRILEDPSIVSFAGGIPDQALFPIEALQDAQDALRGDPERLRRTLQYSSCEGYAPLRQWIAERQVAEGVEARADNVIITSGAQQSLALLAQALLDSGDRIAVGRPTFMGALQVFSLRQPRYCEVELDDEGLKPAALEEAFRAGARLLYVIPDFQNPSGISLSLERRQAVLRLARQYQALILEDVAYRALYYDTPPPPSLMALDGAASPLEDGCVVQVGTVSKTLMPALRVGWTIAPTPLIDKLVLLKQAQDLHTSTGNQVIAHTLSTSILDTHSETLRRVYRERRDAMVSALLRHLPNEVEISRPGGGLFVWLTLPEGSDSAALLRRSLAEEKIAFVPGAAFHADGGGANTLRLSFSTNSLEVIEDGIQRLAALLRGAS